jgi:hypothetical protein
MNTRRWTSIFIDFQGTLVNSETNKMPAIWTEFSEKRSRFLYVDNSEIWEDAFVEQTSNVEMGSWTRPLDLSKSETVG